MTHTANNSTETILKSLIALLAIALMVKVMAGGFL
ncbi:MAG: hypothetical protein C5S44_10345 [Candidatus Methanocomedens sp.]|jgi:hypothetical protein|nr:MAG: hypothetical protein C5S44_10345 [ANME-2 cluster archaeon]